MSPLYLERRGRGRPLVLIHGWAMSAAVWGPLADALAPRWGLYLLDLPGHGRSPWRGATTLEEWAEAALASVPPGAVWLGWSLGGLVALQAALGRPEGIAGLALLCATPRFVQGPGWPHAMAPGVLEAFAADLAAEPAVTLARFLRLQVRGAEGAGETLARLRAARSGVVTRPEALAAGLALLREGDLRTRLGGLERPCRWFLGGRDTLVPAAMGRDLPAWSPDPRVEVIEGAGHTPFLSHTASLVARLTPFLEQCLE